MRNDGWQKVSLKKTILINTCHCDLCLFCYLFSEKFLCMWTAVCSQIDIKHWGIISHDFYIKYILVIKSSIQLHCVYYIVITSWNSLHLFEIDFDAMYMYAVYVITTELNLHLYSIHAGLHVYKTKAEWKLKFNYHSIRQWRYVQFSVVS